MFIILFPELTCRCDPFIKNNRLNPSVLLLAGRRLIAEQGVFFAITNSDDPLTGDAAFYQSILDRGSALLGQPLIIFIVADAVGMPFHQQIAF